jgi:hypothetical protein
MRLALGSGFMTGLAAEDKAGHSNKTGHLEQGQP